MKEKLVLLLLLFISIYSFGKQTYTMEKEDFANQFNATHYLQNVYCRNDKGEKVLLFCNDKTVLTLHFKNNQSEDLMLQSIKLNKGIIEGVKYSTWILTKKVSKFRFEEVLAVSIDRNFQEYERPYFNLDSSLIIVKQKNDSLRNIYKDGYEHIILYTNKINNKNDTFRIVENACYQLKFNNADKAEFGVVQKITEDSIYISNFFNSQMAIKNSTSFKLLKYRISDIMAIDLLKSGGYSYHVLKLQNYNYTVEKRKRNVIDCPMWFAVSPETGEINFYRLWQNNQEVSGVTEKDGKAIWYEGEITHK